MVVWQPRGSAEAATGGGLAERPRKPAANVLCDEQRRQPAGAVCSDLRKWLQSANDRSSGPWRTIQSRPGLPAYTSSMHKQLAWNSTAG